MFCFGLQKPCLSVCHSADGKILIIGTTEGRFIVLNSKLGSHLSTIQVATGAVDSTKISPGRFSACPTKVSLKCQSGHKYYYTT